jgi:hypothetical protein
MSYYDDSSLFVAPNGYKTSVLFAQKPMDANGQLAFTRSNDTATRVGPDGLIQKVRTNVLLQSNSFDTTWATTNATVTSGQAGYDGTNNAWELNSSASGGRILQSNTQAGLQTFSVYAKGSVSSGIRLYAFGTVNANAYFNLNLGTVGAIGGSGVTAKIEAVGGGWYRCSISFNQTNVNVRLYTSDNANAEAAGTIYIQNAQLETGDIATDYIPTTTTAVSVGPVANLPRIDYTGGGCGKLLLEPQRTNLALYSEQLDNAAWTKSNATISANAATSPDGYVNADKLIGDSGAGAKYISASIATPSGVNDLATSFFVKASGVNYIVLRNNSNAGSAANCTFNVSTGENTYNGMTGTPAIEALSDGWYKVTCVNSSSTAATRYFRLYLSDVNVDSNTEPSYTGDGTSGVYIYGAQLETGAYATSYIPTIGAAATRGADSCSKTGISSLIGQTEGTIFVEVNDFSYNPQAVLFKITGLISVQTRTTNQIRIEGTGYDYFYTPTQKHLKIAAAYTASTIVIYVNGVQVHEDTSVTISGGSNLIFNETGNGTEILNQALLFKTRLSNSELASLTTL